MLTKFGFEMVKFQITSLGQLGGNLDLYRIWYLYRINKILEFFTEIKLELLPTACQQFDCRWRVKLFHFLLVDRGWSCILTKWPVATNILGEKQGWGNRARQEFHLASWIWTECCTLVIYTCILNPLYSALMDIILLSCIGYKIVIG